MFVTAGRVAALALCIGVPGLAPAAVGQASDVVTQLFAATADDFESGFAVRAKGGPPWGVEKVIETKGGRMIRAFGKFLYIVDEAHGSILRVDREGGQSQVFDLGHGSAPQDIHVLKGSAYVTRRDNPWLLRVDLATGVQQDVINLDELKHGQAAISLRTMERDGKRLFVQVQFEAEKSAEAPIVAGVLAVVNLSTEKLVDVRPYTPGIQGVELHGAPPRLKMQQVGRTLFVSSSDERLDNQGGIEMVDLDLLQSTGFALSEASFGADLGGFVMTSAKGGYFVFHTDIVASTHLKPFTIDGGVPPGPEMLVLLGDFVDSLAYAPGAKQIYLPSGFASFGATPGIYVFSTVDDAQVGGPIDTGARPHDVVVGD